MPPRRSLLLAGLALPGFALPGLALPRLAQAQPASPAFDAAAWAEAWQAVLQRHVDAQGRIDFARLQAAPQALAAVTAAIAQVDPVARPALFPGPADRLAFWLNAYNALCMHGIVQRGVPEALDLLGRFSFFTRTRFPLGGREISLKSLEDDIIRPLGEERVHFALNCMVRGCPRLPREAFRPASLEAQLAAAATEFCNSAYQVRPNPEYRTVFLSQIFEFYTRDFTPAKAPSLLAYVNRNRAEKLAEDWRVRFFDYDWSINRQPGTA